MSGGIVATVEQTSDQANAEQLAVLVLTRKGERVLVPDFGITDPAFTGVSLTDISLGVTLFGPPVTLEDIDIRFGGPTTQNVTVTFA